MAELIYPQLSYEVIGLLYDVYNELGFGHKEKIYQKAFEQLLAKKNIRFSREAYFPIEFQGKLLSKYFFDFIIDNKIVLELKVAKDFYEQDINQLLSYLKYKKYRLGILVVFSKEELKYRRIVN